MAIVTLAEAKLYTQDKLLSGVVKGIVSRNPLMSLLGFEMTEGNAHAWNVKRQARAGFYTDTQIDALTGSTKVLFLAELEKLAGGQRDATYFACDSSSTNFTLAAYKTIAKSVVAGAEKVARDGTIVSKTGIIVERKTKEVSQYVADAVTDRGDMMLRSNFLAARGENILDKSETLSDYFVHDVLANVKATSATYGRSESISTTRSFTQLDKMIDDVRGDNKVIMMNRSDRRLLTTGLRAVGGATIAETKEIGGHNVMMFDGVPIIPMDFLADGEVHCVSLGKDGLVGIQAGGIMVDDIGLMETKNNYIDRVTWFASSAIKSDGAVATTLFTGTDTKYV